MCMCVFVMCLYVYYVHVCLYVICIMCMYVHVYVCIYVYVYVRVCMCMCVFVCLCVCLYVYVRVFVCSISHGALLPTPPSQKKKLGQHVYNYICACKYVCDVCVCVCTCGVCVSVLECIYIHVFLDFGSELSIMKGVGMNQGSLPAYNICMCVYECICFYGTVFYLPRLPLTCPLPPQSHEYHVMYY